MRGAAVALLLVADHAPMGDAARSLGEAFGVDMRAAYTADSVRAEGGNRTILHFREGMGLHASHPIVAGRDSSERVRHVVALTRPIHEPAACERGLHTIRCVVRPAASSTCPPTRLRRGRPNSLRLVHIPHSRLAVHE